MVVMMAVEKADGMDGTMELLLAVQLAELLVASTVD